MVINYQNNNYQKKNTCTVIENMMHSSVQIIKKINLLGFVRQVVAVVLSNLVLPRACFVLLHIYILSVHKYI